MAQPKCLITGAVIVVGDKYSHGVLHQVGCCLVFNACLEDGETAWNYNKSPSSLARVVSVWPSAIFERRGVIVFDILDARFNPAAVEHMS